MYIQVQITNIFYIGSTATAFALEKILQSPEIFDEIKWLFNSGITLTVFAMECQVF